MCAAASSKSFEYAEAVLSRNIALQSNTANYLASGALTGLSVILGVYSILVTFAVRGSGVPNLWLFGLSSALVLASGAMFLYAWDLCDLGTEVDALAVANDLTIVHERVERVREGVVRSMSRAFYQYRADLSHATLVLALAFLPAIVGVSLFIYGILG